MVKRNWNGNRHTKKNLPCKKDHFDPILLILFPNQAPFPKHTGGFHMLAHLVMCPAAQDALLFTFLMFPTVKSPGTAFGSFLQNPQIE